ncbi:hypothetical protein GGR21_002724 [Dysgonomonas hofstadii]|uniref:Uncharacterized protein n=1 Tax=Dysgonomonas hofstadii TaxID=637886 RepID=A0A840CNZ6_9BACT|nr:hypothetical protein [Dysgonomonas hofstadii]MBB4036811.1 hypothetical protein [Dysgonomonas hofstadii]
MKRFFFCQLLLMALVSFLTTSCSTNDVDFSDTSETDTNYEIKNEAFGEYLYYLGAAGVKKVKVDVSGNEVTKYYVDTVLALKQTEALNLSKSANSISTLETAGLATAAIKITDVDGLQYFVNVTGLTFTSNEIESIDLTRLTKLQTLNLNNNFIGSLDLTKNTALTTLSYTASSKATDTQKLSSIDLSKNVNLTSVDLSNHPGAPFPIPEAIFNQLTTAKGVTIDDGSGESQGYKIEDEAFGEYLLFLNVAGVTEIVDNTSGTAYYIDIEAAKAQTGELSLSKSANAINTLETAGLATASTKITDVDGLQYFINITGIVLTSNEVESIDLTKLTKLETLNLNNNFIGSLDLTKNTALTTLSYTASSKATDAQKLTTIDLSENVNLTSVDLSSHPGAPFPIPAAIYNQLTTAKGVTPEEVASNEYEIADEAFGEYLKYLNVSGVSEKEENSTYKYYIDIEAAKSQTGALNMSKAASYITTLTTAGVRTASTKIKNVDGLQYFINITGITLTSNEVESIDLTELTKLETLNLNNNFIGSLDLTKNTELKTLSYTASSKATDAQKLTTIDLSKNVNLTSVDLSSHSGAPFSIPAAIFNNLTTAKGVVSE